MIDSGPSKSRKVNIIHTYLESSEGNKFSKMVPPCTYIYGMIGSIHPKYQGMYLAQNLTRKVMKHIVDEGIDYYIGNTTGIGITKLYSKMPGFEVIEKSYYADFKDHGRTPLTKLVDGSVNSTILFFDLKKHAASYK